MAARIPEPFQPGIRTGIAAHLARAVKRARRLESKGVAGPWGELCDVLNAACMAVVTHNSDAIVELGKVARPLFESMYAGLAHTGGADAGIIADLLFDSMNPARRERHLRLDNLASYINHYNTDLLKRHYAVRALPAVVPELSYKYKPDDFVLGRPLYPLTEEQFDSFRDGLYHFTFENGIPDAQAKDLERFFGRWLRARPLRKGTDGREYVKLAARHLGVPEEEIKNLYGKQYQRRSRARKRVKAAGHLTAVP